VSAVVAGSGELLFRLVAQAKRVNTGIQIVAPDLAKLYPENAGR
jgi:hypothetical protein